MVAIFVKAAIAMSIEMAVILAFTAFIAPLLPRQMALAAIGLFGIGCCVVGGVILMRWLEREMRV